MNDRRKDQRFKLANGHFVVHSGNIGKIENISMGGLLCSCINDEHTPHPTGTLEIRCLEKQTSLCELNIRILRSDIFPGESIFNVFVRKCHILFEEMSEEQHTRLIDFISSHAAQLS
ncbi:MAG: PilZ domain-containing protein [Thermodesulfobacteriota bacterium]